MKRIRLSNSSFPSTILDIKVCSSFLSKFIGLMFRKKMRQDFGVIFVEKKETRINTAIHMLFVNFNLTILWLDKNQIVVDKVLAKKWMPIYVPKKPAQYVLELHQTKFDDFLIGDQVIWHE